MVLSAPLCFLFVSAWRFRCALTLNKLQRSSAIIFRLEVDVTTNCKELFDDGIMPVIDRGVERREPILILKVDVTEKP
jgi:hypothetical protein